MADDSQNAMAAAGFVQQTTNTTVPSVTTPTVTTGNQSPTNATTTIVSGNNNSIDISSIIQDNSGGLSSIRVLMLLWGAGVFLVWGFGSVMCIIHGNYTFPTIPPEVVTILLGITGVKTVQRFGER